MMQKVKIIFVCTGNTCRSPIAEGYFKTLSDKYDVQSAGIATYGGDAVSENSVIVMNEIGINISGKLSLPLTYDMINSADYIVCLSKSHYNALLSIVPKEKLMILGDGISDPYGLDIDEYRKARDKIILCCNKIFKELEIGGD